MFVRRIQSVVLWLECLLAGPVMGLILLQDQPSLNLLLGKGAGK